MHNMFDVFMNAMLPVFAVIGLAALVGRRFTIDTRVLSNVAIYIFSPFLILQSMTGKDFNFNALGEIIAMVFLSTLVLWFISYIISRLLNFDRKMENAFILCAILANTGNIGLPVISFTFGTEAMQRAVLFFAISNFVLNTLGIYLPSRGNFPVKESIKNVFKVPLMYAVILGILLNIFEVKLAVPVTRMIDLLAEGTVPCMLVILGLRLSRIHVVFKPLPVLLATGTRLLIAPLVGLGLARLLGIDGLSMQASIAEISMPTALMAGLYATQFDCESEFVTTVILTTTICSVLTLSFLLPALM